MRDFYYTATWELNDQKDGDSSISATIKLSSATLGEVN